MISVPRSGLQPPFLTPRMNHEHVMSPDPALHSDALSCQESYPGINELTPDSSSIIVEDEQILAPDSEDIFRQSYAQLICKCLREAPGNQRDLQEIYDWFIQNTNKPAEARAKADDPSKEGWRNSIRHNLSMNRDFIKISNSQPKFKVKGKKKHVWRLSEKALQDGFVLSTTRYRQNPSKRSTGIGKHPVKVSLLASGRVAKRSKKGQNLQQLISPDSTESTRHSSHVRTLTMNQSLQNPYHTYFPGGLQPEPAGFTLEGFPCGSPATNVFEELCAPSSRSTLDDSCSSEQSSFYHPYSPDGRRDQSDWIDKKDWNADPYPGSLISTIGTGILTLPLTTTRPHSSVSVSRMLRLACEEPPSSHPFTTNEQSIQPATCSMAELRLNSAPDDQPNAFGGFESFGPCFNLESGGLGHLR